MIIAVFTFITLTVAALTVTSIFLALCWSMRTGDATQEEYSLMAVVAVLAIGAFAFSGGNGMPAACDAEPVERIVVAGGLGYEIDRSELFEACSELEEASGAEEHRELRKTINRIDTQLKAEKQRILSALR